MKNVTNFVKKGLLCGIMVSAIGLGALPISNANAGVYSIAKSYVGLHERKHTGKLQRHVGVNPRRTPWCGAFAGAVVKRGGGTPPTGYMKATSWGKWGKSVSLNQARRGDVVVVRTKYGHHVGFFAGHDGNKVNLLGGNQSNQVKVSGYRAANIRAIRRGGSAKFPIAGQRSRDKAQSNGNAKRFDINWKPSFGKSEKDSGGNSNSGMRAVLPTTGTGGRSAAKIGQDVKSTASR